MTKMSGKNWAKRISVFMLAFAMLFTVIIPSSMDKVYAEGGANAPVTVNLTISNKTALKDLKTTTVLIKKYLTKQRMRF